MKKSVVFGLAIVIAVAFSFGVLIARPADAAEPTAESLTRRGWLFLEDGEWRNADEYFEKALDIDLEYAPAYLGKLCAELRIKYEADLVNHVKPLDDMRYYQRALRFADAEFRAKVAGYNQAIIARINERNPKIGDIIPFGDYNWLVLDVRDGKALVITERLVAQEPYGQSGNTTWETSTLRRYLNDRFLQKFTVEEQSRISETRIQNPNNIWYGSNGGNDTTDKIFLLSLEEADKYFGDSGDYQSNRRKVHEGQFPRDSWIAAGDGTVFSNIHDSRRVAIYYSSANWWLLRTPGADNRHVVTVISDGSVYVSGIAANFEFGGVRPALWLNM